MVRRQVIMLVNPEAQGRVHLIVAFPDGDGNSLVGAKKLPSDR